MKALFFLVLVVSMPVPSNRADCVCIKDPHPSKEKIRAERRQEYDRASAVFEGKVVAVDAYKVTFRLAKRWKGPSQDEVVLSTGATVGYEGTPLPKECSYQFKLGDEYLVYAYGSEKEMQASICVTLTIKDAADEEKGLDEIRPHEKIRAKSVAAPD